MLCLSSPVKLALFGRIVGVLTILIMVSCGSATEQEAAPEKAATLEDTDELEEDGASFCDAAELG